MQTSKDISREFNRRIFINQMKHKRGKAGEVIAALTLYAIMALCLAAWVYIGFGFVAELLK